MKYLNIKRLTQKVLTSCVLVVFITSCSMITLAGPATGVGELLVTGSTGSGSVTVNGEPAKSGRTIFSSSVISTPETLGAVINLGKAGRIQLAPGSTFTLNVDGSILSGNLTVGSVTVLNSLQSVGVTTLTGETFALNAGETATATSNRSSPKVKPGPGGLDWWIWGAIVGGAVAVVIIAVAVSGDDDNPVTSPVR